MARGAIYRRDGEWVSDASTIEELGIPEGVRQVIGRRLSRLSEEANLLLTAGCAFGGAFPFDIAASVAGLEETRALDALDQALEAQLVRPGDAADRFDFVHANIRHALYLELSPPRQARLHRQIAEALAEAQGASEHAAEIAYHYHRSATLPGANRGVEYAIAAADKAEVSYAHDETVTFLRVALELLPEGDERRPRLLARLGLALAWALDGEGGPKTASKAGDLIAAQEGEDAAADYLAEAARTMDRVVFQRGAWPLAERGLRYARGRRDATWARLVIIDLVRREAEDPDNPGTVLDAPERQEVAAILPPEERPWTVNWAVDFREDALRHAFEPMRFSAYVGDYREAARWHRALANERERRGHLGGEFGAVYQWAGAARCHIALGEFAAAREAYDRALSLAERLGGRMPVTLELTGARAEMQAALGEGEEKTLAELEPVLRQPPAELRWNLALLRAAGGALYARMGRVDEALHWLGTVIPAIGRGPGWAPTYSQTASLAAVTLWTLERTDHIEVIERNLREKWLKPDFRHVQHEARLSLARLCAVQGRYDEAVEWSQKARQVLDEQGARPLRAVVDYDEALMYVRRGRRGDRGRAAPLLEAALSQFRELGMTGWVRRGEELQQQIAGRGSGAPVLPDGLTPREAEVLRLIAAGQTNTEIAEALMLSVRTVGRHITNIYGKIGARNRADAATYAGHHNLT